MKISLLSSLFLFATLAASAEKPNFIVVFTDDHGWPDLEYNEIYDDLRAPHINELAASGAICTNGYSTAPQCIPSRGGLLTGKFQNRFGLESNGLPLDGFNAEKTIAERLKTAGYTTGQIGKWHLGPAAEITNHGFDDVFAKNSNRPGWANFDLEGNATEGGLERSGLYHLDACSAAATAFIDRHAKKPFFLYLAYRAPHVPLDAPKKYLDRFPGEMPERRRQALAMISAMDDGVGAIRKKLQEHGLEENTLIWFIGDNGAPLKIHKDDAPGGGPGWDGSLNEPMNGEKGMLSEGGIRVPFFVAWKGKIPAGKVYEEPVIALDVAATAVELAGLEADDSLDGVNLVPFLTGEKTGAPHEFLTWRWVSQAAIRSGKWKLLRGGEREYLFDLEVDVSEKTNVLAENPEVANRLRKQLTNWSNELKPPGLSTGEMSQTWKNYFDFYLDGKPAPPLPETRPQGKKADPELQGWFVRNAGLFPKPDGFMFVPKRGPKGRNHMIINGISLDNVAGARIDLQTQRGQAGKVGFAWRLKGEKDFQPANVKESDIAETKEFQKVNLPFEPGGEIIHLRLLLPGGTTTIRAIEFFDGEGEAVKKWRFGKNE
ncbi:MAG: sulfatase-like hydrolase/transferase [Verrucomicrobiales bacterium]|nr:sulfatase-like hydrolase/transferase [Verrucomicrobiales bacterium]